MGIKGRHDIFVVNIKHKLHVSNMFDQTNQTILSTCIYLILNYAIRSQHLWPPSFAKLIEISLHIEFVEMTF